MGRSASLAAGPRGLLTLSLILLAALAPGTAGARWVELGGEPFAVNLIEDDGARSVIEITIGGFDATEIAIGSDSYYEIQLGGEAVHHDAGLPALPDVHRSLIIPDGREMSVRLLASEHVDLPGMPVAPSKGHLPRTIDPASVPHSFDEFYGSDGVWPAEIVEAGEPYILRDYRGLLVDANAFQYLPATETLRVHTRLLIEIAPVGPGLTNVLERSEPLLAMDPQFAKLYESQFLNFGRDRYVPVLEDGSILVICYDSFLSSVQPYVDWKLQKGFDTTMVPLSAVGSTYSQIAAYIQGEYDTSDLCYVLLVGDAEQLPRHSGGSDPCYSLVAGGDDYPDLFVGRFSAETPSQAATQVERTIRYERDVTAGEVWPQYGMGVASNQGPGDDGEYDNEHEDVIREKLLAYGYIAVDQIYDPTGTATMVANGLNEGRGIVNYTGHGSMTSWGSTGFSNSNVNALVNDNMLPFINSVACNNGTFSGGTCFAEAWLRATNGGVPTGAIACYMSYISQSWSPPMCAQDESIDLLVADEMRTIGGLWFNGSCQMMDEYGTSGVNEFKNWMLFGDPALSVRSKQAQTMAVSHTGVLLIGMSEYAVDVLGEAGALCALYADGTLYGSALTDAGGHASITLADPPAEPMTLTLTVTAYNRVTSVDDVQVLPPEGPYLVFESCVVEDAAGDNDGVLDEGETPGISITLENVGVDGTTGVSATLASGDEYVTVLEGERDYPDIPAGGFGTCVTPFLIAVAGDVPDGHPIGFTVTMLSNEGSWDGSFNLSAQAPVLAPVGCVVSDDIPGGNGDGNANAGETFYLQLRLANSGHSDAETLVGILSSMSPHVVIHDGTGDCGILYEGGDGLMGNYELELLAGCPDPGNVELHLSITGAGGYVAELDLELPVGGWFDDMEADRGWTAGGVPGDDAGSGIWTRVDPIGTEYGGFPIQPEDDHTADPGALCFVTGQGSVGGSAGENDVDGGKTTLLTPVFQLGLAESASVSYFRWYTNSRGNNPNEDWWDVEVTSDGVTWVSLEHTQASAEEWLPFEFELTDYVALTDQVQLRFVASDEGSGSLVEAGVDDFHLIPVTPVLTSVEDEAASYILRLGSNFPNPFNPKTTLHFDLPSAGVASLRIYDATGRLVTTLVDGALAAGHHELIWDGRDGSGHRVSSGVYFSSLEFGAEARTKKLLLLK